MSWPCSAKQRECRKEKDYPYQPCRSLHQAAEIELSVMIKQCLNRRISSLETLRHELAEWEMERNSAQKAVDWQFTTDDARIKLKRLYPHF
jgi:hypothetical protein